MWPSFSVPPVLHAVLSPAARGGRSLPSGSSPAITVTTFPRGRFSSRSRAVCDCGGRRLGSGRWGGQAHSVSGLPHRSQVGGLSHGVPANRRVTKESYDGLEI